MTGLNARTKKLLLITYLAALSAFAAFSTDAYLASMPTIQQLFATSMANVQLTLSLFFIGFALAQLFWGPLSDRIGRKPVVLVRISVYIVASLFCAWSREVSRC
ncbi:MAG: multidrug effflux MFS transporter [Gammaproteobacteria bacterium]|nr:multidrug effflux MFS transporter [Gammaproteobacteria bacterium]